MRTALDCIPCFVRQALEAARFVTDDPAVHERIVRDVLRMAAEMDLAQCPPVVGQRIHRRLREITGVDDPYRAVKDRFNRMALDTLPELKQKVQEAPDPLTMALRLAIAGNVIDLGVDGSVTEQDARQAVAGALDAPFHGDVGALRRAVEQARSILYLADNAGEIVFDRLLLERLLPRRITVAVKGQPLLNDATLDDADGLGLREFAAVISTGDGWPRPDLAQASDALRSAFKEADVIIAKGQANYEALSESNDGVFFLLVVKCEAVARDLDAAVGDLVLKKAGQDGNDL